MSVQEEYQRRLGMWNKLNQESDPEHTSPETLNRLGFYGGAQGIWVDKKQTGYLTDEGEGIAVSLYHTVATYSDELSEDVLLYHYPHTNRPAARDVGEIKAAKAAGVLHIPVFVIIKPTRTSTRRRVKIGWIEGWDDSSELLLVSFQENAPSSLLTEPNDDEPFKLFDKSARPAALVPTRPQQQRFRFRVIQRYGACCPLCGLDIRDLLDAIHLTPKGKKGSDDPRNGLVLCTLHHRALDTGLFGINPNTLRIQYHKRGPDAAALRITVKDLNNLPRKPHSDALRWLWKEFEKTEASTS
ncbi:HNH endonuclease [Aggregatilinea lenta]|uniref:HNH endonuclease n=1 Tax=Aggregatilinea lenta TaxID=913108 RepID=UPI000E5C4B3A|nr:HNH endonuclease [Aggregatilinea lenta]